MATTEQNALIRVKDAAGDSVIVYPITKAENVDGLEELIVQPDWNQTDPTVKDYIKNRIIYRDKIGSTTIGGGALTPNDVDGITLTLSDESFTGFVEGDIYEVTIDGSTAEYVVRILDDIGYIASEDLTYIEGPTDAWAVFFIEGTLMATAGGSYAGKTISITRPNYDIKKLTPDLLPNTVVDTTYLNSKFAEHMASHAPANAEKNENSFGYIKTDSGIIHSHSPASALTLAGSNVTITPDINHEKLTIGITKDNVTSALGYTPPTTNTTYSAATTSAAGLMSASDKSKLDGIASGANAYTLPAATSSTLGGVKTGSNITNSSGTISLTKANVTSALGYTPPTTNTTYSAMTGATSSAAGTSGLVPAPASGKQSSFLRGDGTWATPTNTTYSAATTSATGLMSASDKSKLDGIASGANAYTLPAATSSTLGGVKTGSNITNSSGTISLTKANVTSALGYTPPTTNTTYSAMTGASSSAAGTSGLVPAPASGKQASFLRGDGTWATPTNTTYSAMTGATSSAAGTSGLVPAPASGKQSSFLRGDGTWATPANTTYSAATTSAAGLMSASDKSKLDGIASGANAYSLPTASSSTLGGVKTTSSVTSNSGYTACPIISGVPYYKDTNTTYTSLKNPYAVTIQGNGTSLGTYDGSAAKTFNITPSNIGAAASSHTHGELSPVTTSGTGAAYTATVSGITALTAGVSFIMVPNVVSTSTQPTLNVNSLGAKYIRRRLSTTTGTTVAGSAANWITADKPIRVIYDGTYWIADIERPSASDIYGSVPITSGGTGATSAEGARTNLGLTTETWTFTLEDGSTVTKAVYVG